MATELPVAATTLRRLELAAGGLAAACMAAMEQRQPWFARLTADQRAAVALVTQTGVSNFVAWLAEPGATIRLTAEAFRIAPRDLTRRISLRQTVELVRIAADVFEQHLPPLAADTRERRVLTESVLRFGREIAFAAATVYAGAAESRGAWDARLEALVVDGVVRGDTDGALVSRAAALGWDPDAPVRCLVGSPPETGGSPDPSSTPAPSTPAPSTPAESPELLTDLRRQAARLGHQILVGVQGRRLVVLLHESGHGRAGVDPATVLETIAGEFGPGAVVAGPSSPDLARASAAVAEALDGLRAAPGWPTAPRPVGSEELLPERALCGDAAARTRLVTDVVGPLRAAGGELLHTLAVYLEGGGALEGCARTLFVHPNTVRYRLKRVGEITGRTPSDPRQAFVLRTALVADRTIETAPAPVPGSGEPASTPRDTPGAPATNGPGADSETARV
ncbi:helix-turn-helix domain-containing protein [Pseudonocardia sp. KRD291]|uniref:PucR family transcriptional regulator n=1 Tax=Pseudonocardia sp. KRD291 TaxID=2792007 RepID=UPI0027E2B338|nr:helix-turn-helix domain-containing protein [Pseudonocardia sp. KRD291]